MKTGTSSDAFVPLGDLLTTEDPVWVWDVSARRILWANRPARIFWGADSLDALKAKRFSSKNQVAETLKRLASGPDGMDERVEELVLPTPSGKKSFRCYLQGLQVAGGTPGFIIKALNRGADSVAAGSGDSPQSKPNRPAAAPAIRSGQSKADRAALRAISKTLAERGKNAPARPKSAGPANSHVALQDQPPHDAIRELAHELGNPLNVIRGFAGWIKEIAPEKNNQDRLEAYASNITEAVDLALAVIRNFSANFENGPSASLAHVSDVKDAAERCISLVAPLAKENGIKIYRRIDAKLPALAISRHSLQQILMNLLINAIRYHKTGKKIKVSCRKLKDGRVRFAISDDGKGMSKKDIKAALRGVPADHAARDRRSGVGLPLVKRIVEDSGGDLVIESERGKGTRITVTFPAKISK